MCCEKVFGMDPDDLFAYESPKVVRVRDRWLGLLRLGFMAAVFVYVVIFVLVLDKKYLDVETPDGFVHLNSFKPRDTTTFVSRFPYCTAYNGTSPLHPNFTLPCEVWDELDTEYPPGAPDSIMLTTRVQQFMEERVCFRGRGNGCRVPWKTVNTTEKIFLAAVESFTIRIQHSFVASRLLAETDSDEFSRSNRNLNGRLLAADGRVVRSFFKENQDIVSLAELLEAADVDLDSLSDASDDVESMRDAGVVLLARLEYDNIDHPDTEYDIHLQRLRGAEFKILNHQYRFEDPTKRRVWNRHGVKIIFVPGGRIGRFSFQVALVQLVSALGLLSVATLIVEFLMLKLMPLRQVYTAYKFQTTEDFSDLKADPALQLRLRDLNGGPAPDASAGGGGAAGGSGGPVVRWDIREQPRSDSPSHPYTSLASPKRYRVA